MDAKLLFVLMGIVQTASGAVSVDSIETEVDHGQVVKFCRYKGLRLLPQSTFIDYDACDECECSDDGLSCQRMVSYVSVPRESKCTSVNIACQNTWVLKADNTKKCRLIPKSAKSVGK